MKKVTCVCCGKRFDELEPHEQPEGYLESLEDIDDDSDEHYCPECAEDIINFIKCFDN